MKNDKKQLDATVNAEVAEVTDFICPCCGVITEYRCRLCGATRTTNQVSGNIIWMKNGRVVSAFTDALQAWIRMASQYNIPQEKWPEQFRNLKIKPVNEFEE
jgi:predicted RNA-binding Zn-ribbon protein involved in translation (DUF1610 family)